MKRLHVGPIHSGVMGRTDHLPMHVPSGSYVFPADVVSGMGEGNTIAGFKVLRRTFGGVPYGGGSGPYGQGAGPYGEPVGKAGGGAVAKTWYHGSPDHNITDWNADKTSRGVYGRGIYVTRRKDLAQQYAGKDGRVYPVNIKGRMLDITHPEGQAEFKSLGEDALRQKYDIVRAPGQSVVLNPSAISHAEPEAPGMANGGHAHGVDEGVPIVAAGGEYVLAPHEVDFAGDGDRDRGHRVLDEIVKRSRAKTVDTMDKLPGPSKN